MIEEIKNISCDSALELWKYATNGINEKAY